MGDVEVEARQAGTDEAQPDKYKQEHYGIADPELGGSHHLTGDRSLCVVDSPKIWPLTIVDSDSKRLAVEEENDQNPRSEGAGRGRRGPVSAW